jgi:hypothetical protein
MCADFFLIWGEKRRCADSPKFENRLQNYDIYILSQILYIEN